MSEFAWQFTGSSCEIQEQYCVCLDAFLTYLCFLDVDDQVKVSHLTAHCWTLRPIREPEANGPSQRVGLKCPAHGYCEYRRFNEALMFTRTNTSPLLGCSSLGIFMRNPQNCP